MAFKLSTGLRQALLSGSGGLRQILANGYIHIYSGTAPATADGEITGTLLATIYSDGGTANAGLNFDAPAGTDSEIRKADAETWDNSVTTNVAGDPTTATHFVFVDSTQEDGAAAGTTAASTSAIRILGTVGTANAGLNLSSTSLTSGEVQAINSFNISIPESLGFS